MENNGIKIGPRSGTRPVATEVIRRAKGSQKGQGEIRGQKGNPNKVRTKGTRVPTGPGVRPRGQGGNLEVAWQKPGGRAVAKGGPGVRRVLGCRRVQDGTGGRGWEWAWIGEDKCQL